MTETISTATPRSYISGVGPRSGVTITDQLRLLRRPRIEVEGALAARDDHADPRLGVGRRRQRLGDRALDCGPRWRPQADAGRRALEAVEVLGQREELAPRRANRLVDAVAVEKAAVEDRDLRLILRVDTAPYVNTD